MRRLRWFLWGGWFLLVLLTAAGARAADVWVQYVAEGGAELRAVVGPDKTCPRMTADGVVLRARPRGTPDAAYPIEVCAARVPPGAKILRAAGQLAPAPPARLNRIVVLGDTGCRLTGRAVQDCNDPAQWPFARIARQAAAERPDLVIHVGDFHYREAACPAGQAGCVGSPFGDNWPVWRADFLAPAAPLLAAAPWVMVRGNHEICTRGGQGWFRLFDPHADAQCTARTATYALTIGEQQFLVLDGADADDRQASAEPVEFYRQQLATLLGQARPHAWLLTHRPIWALAEYRGARQGEQLNATQQAAIRGLVPPGLDMVISGHVHNFTSYDFGPDRPAQLVVGNGGTSGDPIDQPLNVGTVIDGLPIQHVMGVAEYGYLVLDRAGDGWKGTLRGLGNTTLARCEFRARTARCRE